MKQEASVQINEIEEKYAYKGNQETSLLINEDRKKVLKLIKKKEKKYADKQNEEASMHLNENKKQVRR